MYHINSDPSLRGPEFCDSALPLEIIHIEVSRGASLQLERQSSFGGGFV